ncbi:hypothetical protein pdam_00006341 [Pocillopora damicornis]|uniref:Uncharacterized protein n=1 Tax=Pocillopora damicornis TaxID=46731 RepID=A0A3M6TQV7_POCDA|nr:hypothetical protein pdam_00006341 [Pocillopora damicornis]
MRDCYCERDTGIGDFEEQDSGNTHLNEQRTRMSHRRSGCSATLFSYCAGMTIISEAKSPIYQKPSMAHRETWHRRVLRQLIRLTQVSEFYRYDALNILSQMRLDVKNIRSVVHHKDKLLKCSQKGLKRTTHWAMYYFRNPNSNVP